MSKVFDCISGILACLRTCYPSVPIVYLHLSYLRQSAPSIALPTPYLLNESVLDQTSHYSFKIVSYRMRLLVPLTLAMPSPSDTWVIPFLSDVAVVSYEMVKVQYNFQRALQCWRSS